jgi:hypothetical protein
LRAAPAPALGVEINRTRGSSIAEMIPAVPSREPSSTAIISKSDSVCSSTLAMVAPM